MAQFRSSPLKDVAALMAPSDVCPSDFFMHGKIDFIFRRMKNGPSDGPRNRPVGRGSSRHLAATLSGVPGFPSPRYPERSVQGVRMPGSAEEDCFSYGEEAWMEGCPSSLFLREEINHVMD